VAPNGSGYNDPHYLIGAGPTDVSVEGTELSRLVQFVPTEKSRCHCSTMCRRPATPTQLAAQITMGLNKYMTNPQVTVIVSEINSQRIYILGEVARAGAYVLLPGMTVLQALSNAGGFTPFSNVKNVHVLRQENGKQQKLFFNYKEVISGKRTEQNIELKPGDTIVCHSSRVKAVRSV
jgi:protein involved in polysaccharide export with SLBB domain